MELVPSNGHAQPQKAKVWVYWISFVYTDPAGRPIAQEEYDAQVASWLPSAGDREFVASVMQRVVEPGKMAAWIAPPEKGIKDRPVDYEYVRLA